MASMNWVKEVLRKFFSQEIINTFWHLPKAVLANIFYDFPAIGEARQRRPTRGLKVIGVTGTDGKTTTVNMIYKILKTAGKKISMVSTINAPGFHVTSPDPFIVQKFLRNAVDSGDEYMVLEVTSHALDQYRFWGVQFDVGVITNITHEHLDYHKTFENYSKAKLNLIRNVKFAIINNMLTQSLERSFKKMIGGKVITFGFDRGDFNQKEVKLKLKIPGIYNIENGLAALAVAFVLDIPKQIAQKTLEKFEGLNGRMEEVKNSRGIKIIIDFAHTPNGLEQALKTLASQAWPGRLIALIGCEGYRDVGKRTMMGEIAQKLADIVIVTAVDPRGQIKTINRQIEQGALKAGAKPQKNFYIIEDRQQAINFAINILARKGDIVALFGKGHENSMNMDGKKEIPWSDKGGVKKALYG